MAALRGSRRQHGPRLRLFFVAAQVNMNFAIGSKNALRARVDELLLGDRADEMATLGWSTFGVFAFSTSLVLSLVC